MPCTASHRLSEAKSKRMPRFTRPKFTPSPLLISYSLPLMKDGGRDTSVVSGSSIYLFQHSGNLSYGLTFPAAPSGAHPRNTRLLHVPSTCLLSPDLHQSPKSIYIQIHSSITDPGQIQGGTHPFTQTEVSISGLADLTSASRELFVLGSKEDTERQR